MTDVSNLITDYLLAAFAALLGALLVARGGSLPARLWGWALLAAAAAAVAGGTWHGFQRLLTEDVLFWLWKAVIYLVAAFGLTATGGSILSATSGRVRTALMAVLLAGTATYAGLMATRDAFIYVSGYGAAAMALVLAIHLAGWRRRDPASPWMVAGVGVSVVGAAIEAGGLTLHEYFDNNDLFHLIQMAGFYLLYRGARQLAPGPTNG